MCTVTVIGLTVTAARVSVDGQQLSRNMLNDSSCLHAPFPKNTERERCVQTKQAGLGWTATHHKLLTLRGTAGTGLDSGWTALTAGRLPPLPEACTASDGTGWGGLFRGRPLPLLGLTLAGAASSPSLCPCLGLPRPLLAGKPSSAASPGLPSGRTASAICSVAAATSPRAAGCGAPDPTGLFLSDSSTSAASAVSGCSMSDASSTACVKAQ